MSVEELPAIRACHRGARGPENLLTLLPEYIRPLIGRMLELDPEKRPQLNEILAYEWIVRLGSWDIPKTMPSGGHTSNTKGKNDDAIDLVAGILNIP
jgi:serine/threonine protein kinase